MYRTLQVILKEIGQYNFDDPTFTTLEMYFARCIEVEYNQTDAGKNYYRIKREGLKRLRYQYKEFITTNKMILQMNVNLSSSHSSLSSACVHVYIHKYPL